MSLGRRGILLRAVLVINWKLKNKYSVPKTKKKWSGIGIGCPGR